MIIKPDNEKLQYSGRIDFDNMTEPVFIYAGSFVRLQFRGDEIRFKLRNYHSYYENTVGYELDGTHGKILLDDTDALQSFSLKVDKDITDHDLILYKRMDACHYYSLNEIEIVNGDILKPPAMPVRKMEVFGDSISCGEICEATDREGQPDPDNHNGHYTDSWYSYSWIAARKLNAELHITSQGGSALLDGTGWFNGPDYVGMETMFDKYSYNANIFPYKQWDFGIWKPDLVVIALGQNDNHPVDRMKDGPSGEGILFWKEKYKSFLMHLMSEYPNAHFVLSTTIMFHDDRWDDVIKDIANEISSDRVHYFEYSLKAKGTPGHVRIGEAHKMADELVDFVNSLGDIWNE